MLKYEEHEKIIKYLNNLQTDEGGYSDSVNSSASLQSTLSVLKSLEYFGISPQNPDNILTWIKSHYDINTGGFTDPSTKNLSVLSSAVGMLILHQIGATEFFNECMPKVLNYMDLNATSREEHFMLIGFIEECKISFHPKQSIEFFKRMEDESGAFGPSVLNTAIAASALLRIGETLKNLDNIKSILLSSQQKDGGFADTPGTSDLWTSYCVMRTLDLVKTSPDTINLQAWILSRYLSQEGFALSGSDLSANIAYQCLSILNWIVSPVINSAKTGDITELKKWLIAGGNPDVMDFEGWTPLMAASVRGQSEVVEFLLSHGTPGGRPANLALRFKAADASPIFWTGQSGDVNTAKALLKYNPEQLFDISSVNGHNLLLQAAFFGSEKHLDLAGWILENTGQILGIPQSNTKEIEDVRLRLTTATNVRGYNGLTMSSLWGNKPMEKLFSIHDKSTEADRQAYLQRLLALIAIPKSDNKNENFKQQLSDQFIETISEGLLKLNTIAKDQPDKIKEVQRELMDSLQSILSNPDFDINRLGGPLSGTPIISAVTGVDSSSEIAEFRLELVSFLLGKGADPDIPEKHPMGVDAVIRAAVLNHFPILKLLSENMKPLAFAAAINYKPPINGQTALQDTVHRALTAPQDRLSSHLDQIKWCLSKGARYNIEDHTGTSPEKLARQALKDSVYSERAEVVLNALGISENI